MKNLITALVLLLLLPGLCRSQSETIQLSYAIGFKIKNAGITVDGSFKGFKGMVHFVPGNLSESSLQGTIEVNTINTGNQARDNHLRTDDFFDVTKYPLISMKSIRLYEKNGGYEGVFNLTIKDVTKEVTIPFTYKEKTDMATLEADLSIDRRDYHVGGYSIIMSDEVNVHILVNVLK